MREAIQNLGGLRCWAEWPAGPPLGGGMVLGKGQRGARIGHVDAVAQPRPGSSDADIVRASQLQHAVEHMDGNVHLGRPTLVRVRAQPVADHLFPPPDGGLSPSAFVVPGSLLPSHAPVLGDALEMVVALRPPVEQVGALVVRDESGCRCGASGRRGLGGGDGHVPASSDAVWKLRDPWGS